MIRKHSGNQPDIEYMLLKITNLIGNLIYKAYL